MTTTTHSELWQRIRATRKFAMKTQHQVAKACGVSRPAVTLWESTTPDNRTQPSASQIMQIAELCNVSAQFLLDDSARPDDVYTYGSAAALRAPAVPRSDLDTLNRQAKAFWAAVKFTVLASRPELEESFDVQVVVAGQQLTIPFLHGEHLVMTGSPAVAGESLTRELGLLLVLERACGHPYKKFLYRWAPASAPGAAPRLDPSFDMTIQTFHAIDAAANALLKL